MLAQILPYMRCPRCYSPEMSEVSDGLSCPNCAGRFPFRNGILDMLSDDSSEVITPFQRLMQTPLIVSIYEQFWRKAGYFLASSRSFGKEMRTVISMGLSRAPDRALDLACGTGVFTRPLARATGAPVVGLDLSRPMLLHARRLAKKEGTHNIFFMRATAFSLPFANSSFSYVNCCGALHLFDRPGAALAEIARVLQPGGCLCVQTTIRPNRSAGFAYFLENFIRFGFFDEDELRKQLAHQGFEIVESERHRISFTFLAKSADQ
jgi:ubiquinone/menaquinone biosynthesis C-methylase UbiE